MGPYCNLDELGLDSIVKAKVLEWFAMKVWRGLEEGSGRQEYYGKSYDPLTIELSSDGKVAAHSYVFSFEDGGRYHLFENLDALEKALENELITGIRNISEDS